MTTVSTSPPLAQRGSRFVFIGLLAGLAIGALTLLLQGLLPNSILQIANSGAFWSIVAFVLGWRAPSVRVAAIAGFIALVGEVTGYYTAAYFADLMDISAGTMAIVGYWLFVALLAGPLFGWAGYQSRHGAGLREQIARAALGAAFVGEGLHLLMILPTPNTGLLWIAIAVVITLALTWKRHDRTRIWLIWGGLSVLFFGAMRGLVLLDELRSLIAQA